MPNDEDAYQTLARIAAALGMEVRDFYGEAAFEDERELSELLHLWDIVTDRPSRMRILSLARQEALRCRVRDHA